MNWSEYNIYKDPTSLSLLAKSIVLLTSKIF